MKALLIVGLVLLAGCTLRATRDLDLAPEARLFQAQGEFNILLEAANSYAQRPRCSPALTIGCSEPRVIDEILQVSERVTAALKATRAAETPTMGLVTVIIAELNALLVRALATGTGV